MLYCIINIERRAYYGRTDGDTEGAEARRGF